MNLSGPGLADARELGRGQSSRRLWAKRSTSSIARSRAPSAMAAKRQPPPLAQRILAAGRADDVAE